MNEGERTWVLIPPSSFRIGYPAPSVLCSKVRVRFLYQFPATLCVALHISTSILETINNACNYHDILIGDNYLIVVIM